MDGILLINKPAGYTSHDIVGIVRKKLHTKKVGHCGTLDPDATGVLVVCVNKATKAIQFLMSDTKVYRATLSLGKSTDTYDASGKILEEKEVGQISKAQVIDVLNSFLGKSKQKPPIYSAIKVNGKKLYEYARNGEEVEIKERDIEIMMIELIDFSNNEIVFDVKCSKGTYIRSLCVDIAKKLGYPGHMSHLERRQAGRFLITDCITLEQLENDDYSLHSIDDALCGFPQLKLDDPTPFLRGIVAELGYKRKEIPYEQPKRRAGKTHNNFYRLYDAAMLSVTSYTKEGLRLATIFGGICAAGSMIIALTYLVMKLIWWDRFPAGMAPMLIGMLFLGSVQLFFIGFLGEYIMSINQRVMKRPLVIEEERLNFDQKAEIGKEDVKAKDGKENEV